MIKPHFGRSQHWVRFMPSPMHIRLISESTRGAERQFLWIAEAQCSMGKISPGIKSTVCCKGRAVIITYFNGNYAFVLESGDDLGLG